MPQPRRLPHQTDRLFLHRELARRFPYLNVFGGCRGTDYVHVRKICEAVQQAAA